MAAAAAGSAVFAAAAAVAAIAATLALLLLPLPSPPSSSAPRRTGGWEPRAPPRPRARWESGLYGVSWRFAGLDFAVRTGAVPEGIIIIKSF